MAFEGYEGDTGADPRPLVMVYGSRGCRPNAAAVKQWPELRRMRRAKLFMDKDRGMVGFTPVTVGGQSVSDGGQFSVAGLLGEMGVEIDGARDLMRDGDGLFVFNVGGDDAD